MPKSCKEIPGFYKELFAGLLITAGISMCCSGLLGYSNEGSIIVGLLIAILLKLCSVATIARGVSPAASTRAPGARTTLGKSW